MILFMSIICISFDGDGDGDCETNRPLLTILATLPWRTLKIDTVCLNTNTVVNGI